MSNEQAILNTQWNAAAMACAREEELLRPFYLVRPVMRQDGNAWCAFYGENIQSGVCGFGASPEEAAVEFDKAWRARLPDNEEKSLLREKP